MTPLGPQQHCTVQHSGTALRSETPPAQTGAQPTPGRTWGFVTRLRLTARAEHPRKEPAQRLVPADTLTHEGFVSRDEAQMNLSISAATEAGAQRGKRSGRRARKGVSNMSSTGQQSGTDKAISFSREVVHGQQEPKQKPAPRSRVLREDAQPARLELRSTERAPAPAGLQRLRKGKGACPFSCSPFSPGGDGLHVP